MKKLCGVHGVFLGRQCPGCKKNNNKVYDKIYRDEELKKFYQSSLWQKIRHNHLVQNPICAECGAVGEIVDHIIEIRDGGDKYSTANLQTLCRKHHGIKTALQKTKRGGGHKSLQECRRFLSA